jgi:endonuclease/exonuclease/phosphatase (EEP) superfamily protein YafD
MIESPDSGVPTGFWSRVARGRLRSPLVQGSAVGGLLSLIGLMLAGRSISHAPAFLTACVVLLPVLWGGYALFIGTLALVARSRRLGTMALIASVVWLGTWGRAWTGDSETMEGESLTILNWNLQRLAWGEPGGLECIVEAVEQMNPDVLALTEVSKDEVDTLKELLDLQCVHVDYKGTDEHSYGGLASCARQGRWQLGHTERRRYVDGHDWFYSFAEFQRNEEVFNLLTIHLQPYRFGLGEGAAAVVKAQAREADGLLWRVRQLVDPTIVAGDFNSPRDAEIHVRIREHLRDTWEVGGWGAKGTVRLLDLLPMRVDYIYASQEFGVHRSQIPEVDCTDHRPVLSEVILEE